MWTLIHLYEENGDTSPDLIPNEWMLNDYSCWYPKDFKLSTIKSYAKRKENPCQDQWEKCKIEVIEKNIDNYEYGIKLIYKVNKHLNSNSLDHSLNLHSEVEERGRGQRTKQKKNRQESKQNMNIFEVDDDHSNSDEVDNHDSDDFGGEKSVKRTPNLVMYPEFPKKQKVTHRNEKVYCLSNNTPSGSRYQNNTSITDRTAMLAVADIFCECKLSKKIPHSCTFGTPNQTNVSLLEAIGHQLCRLSADILKIKNYTNYIKQDLTSFIDNDDESSRNNNQRPEKILLENSILSSFPLKNDNELLSIEKNLLSEDLGYTNKLVTAFIFASEGKTITKVTNSILRTVISDDLAKEYSWKGQKNKNSFKDLIISKIIIDAVLKKFPNIQDSKEEIKRSIMTWLAQAPTRIIRFNTIKNAQTPFGSRESLVHGSIPEDSQ